MFRVLRSGLQRTSSLATTKSFRFFSATYNGNVKWFDPKKGFGFIIPEDGSPDVFVHQSVIHADGFRSLADGEPVEYTLKTDEQGRTQAELVTGPMGAYVQGVPRRTFGRSIGGGPGEGLSDSSGGNFGVAGFGSGVMTSEETAETVETAEAPSMPAMEKEEDEDTEIDESGDDNDDEDTENYDGGDDEDTENDNSDDDDDEEEEEEEEEEEGGFGDDDNDSDSDSEGEEKKN